MKKNSIVIVLIFKITCIANGVSDKQKELKESNSRCIMYVNIYLLFFLNVKYANGLINKMRKQKENK